MAAEFKTLGQQVSSDKKVKTFLPVIDVFILRINIIEHNIVLKADQSYINISGSSAATKFGVNLVPLDWSA